MQRASFALVLLGCLAALPVPAREPAAGEGLPVEDLSPLRKLVPAGELEVAASQQYDSLKAQAASRGLLLPATEARAQRVRSIAQRLIPQATRWNPNARQWQWEVSVLASPQLNAFCMPGGKIGIYTGLLDQLQLTDEELAIVIGHEIAHALREHGRERLAKSSLTSTGARLLGVGLSALLGIDADFTDAAAHAGANLAVLKFSRSDETEADLVGMDLAARAGFDPRAGIALWRKMEQVSQRGRPQWLSTHPAGEARIAEMQKHLPSVLPLYAQAKGVPQNALPPYQTNINGVVPIK